MKKKIALIIGILIIVVICGALVITMLNPKNTEPDYPTPPTVNEVPLGEYVIVYDEEALDYNKRAAEYIKNTITARYGIDLPMIDDDTAKNPHEIVVGETSRDISSSLNGETSNLEFAILANEDGIALEGDYFVIAAAAYYFTETYAIGDGEAVTVPQTVTIHEPIVKKAKNYILLIGDGMGLYHTKMFEYMENSCDYSDGEDMFYGYMLPYLGYSRTNSLSGTTDSAAGGTALACGYKTLNGYVGVNIAQKPVKSLTELADELQMDAAVMSTETQTGATPSTFLAHVTSRSYTDILITKIYEAREKYGTVVSCGFDYYSESYMKLIENKVQDALAEVSSNENGFFLMYEEAHIDKHSHDNNMNKSFLAVIRFNQVIARFMEFAFYNPETMIVITADHETGDLYPEENGALSYHHDDHTSADVPVFAYGIGAELFDGQNVENIQIAHTIAALMGVEDFGDQSKYQSLTKATE